MKATSHILFIATMLFAACISTSAGNNSEAALFNDLYYMPGTPVNQSIPSQASKASSASVYQNHAVPNDALSDYERFQLEREQAQANGKSSDPYNYVNELYYASDDSVMYASDYALAQTPTIVNNYFYNDILFDNYFWDYNWRHRAYNVVGLNYYSPYSGLYMSTGRFWLDYYYDFSAYYNDPFLLGFLYDRPRPGLLGDPGLGRPHIIHLDDGRPHGDLSYGPISRRNSSMRSVAQRVAEAKEGPEQPTNRTRLASRASQSQPVSGSVSPAAADSRQNTTAASAVSRMQTASTSANTTRAAQQAAAASRTQAASATSAGSTRTTQSTSAATAASRTQTASVNNSRTVNQTNVSAARRAAVIASQEQSISNMSARPASTLPSNQSTNKQSSTKGSSSTRSSSRSSSSSSSSTRSYSVSSGSSSSYSSPSVSTRSYSSPSLSSSSYSSSSSSSGSTRSSSSSSFSGGSSSGGGSGARR